MVAAAEDELHPRSGISTCRYLRGSRQDRTSPTPVIVGSTPYRRDSTQPVGLM